MKRSVRTVLPALAAVLSALTASGCSGDAPAAAGDRAADEITEGVDRAFDEKYEITYEVSGDGVEAIEFNAGAGTATEPELDAVEKPETPWRKTVELKGVAAPTVLAVPGPGGSEVTCTITHKGEVIEEQTSEGATAPASCVALSPVAG
ncbi:MmpS family transport accessory protein [Streptomyces xinghaiensis]|uniref:MmpS family transport accessory protein n=1 Tax=Streptomyces xinghaiensis TaxID=1038928 RepID=UPI002E0D4924|nr:MmpS family transport accessory protein [Streptomyces xinghaiensis]